MSDLEHGEHGSEQPEQPGAEQPVGAREAHQLQPEVDDRHDSIVIEGDDADHVFPPSELDPYTPEPGPRAGDRRAFRVMWVAIAIIVVLIAVVIYVAVR
jgi:hypothetical protein